MKRLLTRLIHSFAVQRVVTAVLSFSAMIAGARVLPADTFAVLLQVAFLAKFLQIANLGAASGYFVSRYSGEGPLVNATGSDEGRFTQSYGLHLVGVSGLLLIGAALLVPGYVPGLVAFTLFIPLYISEPLFRYRRFFYFSLLPDLFLAFAMWSVVAAHLSGQVQGLALVYFAALLALVISLVVLVVRRVPDWTIYMSARPFSPRNYAQTLRLGLPVYLGTALFMLASSADRLLLPLHLSARDLNLYFLAYQLATGAMLFVTSINFVNAVDLGRARQDGSKLSVALLWHKMWQAAVVTLASIAILAVAVYVLEHYILGADYVNLLRITLTLTAGLGMFFLAGTVTPVLAYLHKQMPMTWLMGGIACILFANNTIALLYGFSIFCLASVTSVGFFIYALIAITYTFHSVRTYVQTGSNPT